MRQIADLVLTEVEFTNALGELLFQARAELESVGGTILQRIGVIARRAKQEG